MQKRSYGSGSIIERRGSYYGKWHVDGKPIWRKLGPTRSTRPDGLTRKQAEAKLRELMATVKVEAAAPKSSPTIAELVDAYIDYGRNHKGLKESTLDEYGSAVANHFEPFFKDTPIDKIDSQRIERFAEHLRIKKGQGKRGGEQLAPKTVENILGSLGTLLRFAAKKKKWIDVSPLDGQTCQSCATRTRRSRSFRFLRSTRSSV